MPFHISRFFLLLLCHILPLHYFLHLPTSHHFYIVQESFSLFCGQLSLSQLRLERSNNNPRQNGQSFRNNQGHQ
ncbi:hypothetical protein P8452_13446 [Trifolium repens]|nr:hypothetical protein P8452_13446 [Trifolium repens]